MRAFITGITGFVGGFLAEHLLAEGDEVMGCARSAKWPKDAPADVQSRAQLVAWDIGDPDGPAPDVSQAIADFAPDCIYHLSAISIPSECGDDAPTPLARAVNIEGTQRVWSLASSLSSPPRLLFTSSSHVYAAPAPGAPPVKENGKIEPRRGYGITKWEAERLTREFAKGYSSTVIIARAFQHTGPRQSSRMMLPQWAEQFARGANPVEVYSRDKIIDLSDVRDVVRAYRLLVDRGGPGGVFNVGSGVARRTGEVLDILRQLADPNREIVELRPGPGADPIADVRRLQAATGWRPHISLEQLVADVWSDWQARVAA